ncbi:MAG: acetyl-coenzyme A synthetase [Gemmatimonadota bacterium]
MTDAWVGIRAEFPLPPEDRRNITASALTRHVRSGASERVALRWRPRSGPTVTYTYGDLDRAASRFASGLVREGIAEGQTVAILAGRIPELVVALLGTLRAGAVSTVLFSSFGPEPVLRRLQKGRTHLLVTTPRLYRDKVAPIRDQIPELEHVLVVEGPGRLAAMAALHDTPEGTRDFGSWLAQGSPDFPDAEVEAEDPALLHFTSGTTGEPKGVVHVHDAVVAHHHTGKTVLGLSGSTRYWCTADPGWVTGVSYGILSPLSRGSTLFMDEEEFDAQRWWENLASERIEVLYTAPTALRMLRRMHQAGVRGGPLPSLRSVFSVGEPLAHAEAEWGAEALGVPVRDTWWQTETGCIVVATCWNDEPRPGQVGRAVPGFHVASLHGTEGHAEVAAPGTPGELCVRTPWPSMFRTYLGNPTLYARSFLEGWYLSGDVAEVDHEGWVTFVGRRGDVFKSAGHLISPAEVEDVVLQHPAVADVGVWGRHDPVAGTVVEAHVVLSPGHAAGDDLAHEILAFARSRLGPALAPRALRFRDLLPRTPSGKIVRKDLGTSPS